MYLFGSKKPATYTIQKARGKKHFCISEGRDNFSHIKNAKKSDGLRLKTIKEKSFGYTDLFSSNQIDKSENKDLSQNYFSFVNLFFN